MRKRLGAVWMLALLIAMSGCAIQDSDTRKDSSAQENRTEKIVYGDSTVKTEEASDSSSTTSVPPTPAGIYLAEHVIFEEGGIVITVTGIDLDAEMGPDILLSIENNSNHTIIIQPKNSSVNGAVMDLGLSTEVASGIIATDEMKILKPYLELADIETIKDIEFELKIIDRETWNYLYVSNTIRLTTSGSEEYEQGFGLSGMVVLEQDGIRVTVRRNDEKSFWGPGVTVFVDNRSGRTVTVELMDTSMNKRPMDFWFSVEVPAGKVAFDSTLILNSDLEEIGIEVVESVSFKVVVLDTESILNKLEWEDSDVILKSEKIEL